LIEVKNILLACGAETAASTVVMQRLSRVMDERGFAGKYKITQCKIAEAPAKSASADVCVAIAQVAGDTKCPVVRGSAFLSGHGAEPALAEIIKYVE
jgi:PTS system galactitol-specific IIB component